MMPTIGQGSCLTCQAPFPIPANNPHRRFCSPCCRAADWRTRHGRKPRRHVDAVRNAVSNPSVDDLSRPDAVPTANGVQRCPHCQAPLAVIAVVVPPTAAHVRIPEPTHA
jgi:hypothetical protein